MMSVMQTHDKVIWTDLRDPGQMWIRITITLSPCLSFSPIFVFIFFFPCIYAWAWLSLPQEHTVQHSLNSKWFWFELSMVKFKVNETKSMQSQRNTNMGNMPDARSCGALYIVFTMLTWFLPPLHKPHN